MIWFQRNRDVYAISMAFICAFICLEEKERIVVKTGPILYSEACIKLLPLSIYLQL